MPIIALAQMSGNLKRIQNFHSLSPMFHKDGYLFEVKKYNED